MKSKHISLFVLLFLFTEMAYATSDQAPIMSLQGELSVNRQGAAAYSVPLTVPPGPGQLAPDLSINYNSHTGHGLLGYAWQLSGLSRLHRCVAIPSLHGHRRGIFFSEHDRLCLDGQFLQRLPQSSPQQIDYRTQPDQFVRIRTRHAQNPTHFVMHTKPGLILEFGGRHQAWVEQRDERGKRRILAWLLSRIRDHVGNHIDFHYRRTDSGEVLLDLIHYGPNRIRFHYQKKSRPLTLYIAGVAVSQQHLLSRIDMQIEQATARSYHFFYNDKEQLRAVNACVKKLCLQPTRFDWHKQPPWQLEVWGEGIYTQALGHSPQRYRSADFNGDGLSDLYEIVGLGDRQAAVHINQGDGSFYQYDGPWHQVDKNDDFSHFFTADFNGDGLSDIYHFRHQHDDDVIYLTSSANDQLHFTSIAGIRRDQQSGRPVVHKKRCVHSRCFRFADFNGDGLSDVYHIRLAVDADAIHLSDGGGGYNTIAGIISDDGQPGAAIMQTDRVRVADFNGDGRADIYFIKPDKEVHDLVYLNLADGRYQVVQGIKTAINLSHDNGLGLLRMRLGDFNGDGLSDIYYAAPRNQADQIYLSHGDGQYTQRQGVTIQRPSSADKLSLALQRMKLADVNGDGRTDLYLIDGREGHRDQLYLAQTDGSLALAADGLDTVLSGRSSEQVNQLGRLAFADFNGDGAADLLSLPANNEQLVSIHSSTRHVHLLGTIKSGLGGVHQIDYSPLPQASFHHRAASAAYPIVRTPPAIDVVARVHHRGGSDDTMEYYSYGGSYIHAAGEGFLGFDWLEQRRHNGLLAQRSHYRLEFPYQGSVLQQQEKILTDAEQEWDYGHLINASTYHYEHIVNAHHVGFPVLREMHDTRYEYNGGEPVHTVVRYHDYDVYGNVGTVETVTSGDGSSFSEQVSSTYHNDEERWIIGRPQLVETSYDDGTHDEIVRHTRFDYLEDSGLLLSKIIEPEHALGHREDYRYDEFGNQISVIAAALDNSVSRRRQQQYDDWGRFVTHTTNPAGHTESYQYDVRFGQPTQITDANGRLSHRQYDDWGRLLKEQRGDGSEVVMEYLFKLPADAPMHSAYAVRTESRGSPRRTSYYDHHHRMLREERSGFDGRTVRRDRVYDALGRRVQESFPYYADEEPVWTHLHYDILGRLIKKEWLVDGMPVEESIAYHGLRTAYINESGLLRWLQHDALGRVVQIDEALDASVRFEYDAVGQVLGIVDGERNSVTMNYDLFGRLLHIKDANRGERHFTYNVWGEMLSEVDANGDRFQHSYDALGRLRQRQGPDGRATWLYDSKPNAIGKLVRVALDDDGREFNYDAYGRLASTIDHRGYTFIWHYDDAGRLARLTQPGGFIIERLYNPHGYLHALRSPLVVPESQSLEYADHIASWRSQARFYQLLAGRSLNSTSSSYQSLVNAAHHLQQGADRLAELVNTPLHSLARAVQCLAQSQHNLNQAKLLLAQAERAGETPASLIHRAQALHLVEQSEACVQRAQWLSPDDDNMFYHWRVLRRDATGRVELEHAGNDWQTERVFDQASGRPLSIRSLHHGVEQRDWHYIYDQRGNLIQRQDSVAALSQWFDYDELDRLVSVNSRDEKNTTGHRRTFYHYDSHGNLQFDSDDGAYLYGGGSAGPHALSALGEDHSYRYDRKGRLLDNQRLRIRWLSSDQPELIHNKQTDQWLRLSYDAERKLTAKESSHAYRVDYAGKTYRRMQQGSRSDEECHTVYAESRALLDVCHQRHGGSGGWRLFYYHYDALGSVDTISDWQGQLLDRATYSAFGQCHDQCLSTVAGVSRGFGGHEHLLEVGLVHMNGRIYNPHGKQFLNPDAYQTPLYFTQSYNPYRYGFNNPLRYADPSGYFVKSLVRKIKRVVGSIANFVQRNARPLAAAFVGYQIGAWAGGHFLRQATAQLIWSPGAMASGTYMAAYSEAVASSAIAAGLVAGGSSGLLAGGGIRGIVVNALSGGAFARLGVVYQNQWTPGRVLAGGLISGTASTLQGGHFADGALGYLQGGTLKAIAVAMRRAMIAQSSLDARNMGASSAGFMGDGIKLGGGRYNPSATAAAPSLLGGHQGQSGLLFGHPYAPGSWQDLLVEAYAGPHDYLNSFYWYDNFGNIRPGISTAGWAFGRALNYANVVSATPLVAASVVPDYFYALPR